MKERGSTNAPPFRAVANVNRIGGYNKGDVVG